MPPKRSNTTQAAAAATKCQGTKRALLKDDEPASSSKLSKTCASAPEDSDAPKSMPASANPKPKSKPVSRMPEPASPQYAPSSPQYSPTSPLISPDYDVLDAAAVGSTKFELSTAKVGAKYVPGDTDVKRDVVIIKIRYSPDSQCVIQVLSPFVCNTPSPLSILRNLVWNALVGCDYQINIRKPKARQRLALFVLCDLVFGIVNFEPGSWSMAIRADTMTKINGDEIVKEITRRVTTRASSHFTLDDIMDIIEPLDAIGIPYVDSNIWPCHSSGFYNVGIVSTVCMDVNNDEEHQY
jgi:hypothetical protein